MENTKVYVLQNGYSGVTHASTSLDEVLSYFRVEDYDLNNPEEYRNLTHSHILAFDKTGVADEMYVYVESLNKICRVDWDMSVIEDDVVSNVKHFTRGTIVFTCKDGFTEEYQIPKDYKYNPMGFIEMTLKETDYYIKGELVEINSYHRTVETITKEEVGE